MEPLVGDVSVTLRVYRQAKRGDLDNSIKVSLDSLIGVAYADDSQIVRIVAERYDDKRNPRVEVEVTPA
jgi:Holliday junction resolvase RusA-like endonuclease